VFDGARSNSGISDEAHATKRRSLDSGLVIAVRLRILVTGLIAQYPLGGVAWDYVQYPVGLARLGHDVYYLEDTGQWPYNPVEGATGDTPGPNVDYLGRVMAEFGLTDRWAYRFPRDGQWHGMTEDRVSDLIASADLLINVSGTLDRPDRYRGHGRLAYIDSDPVFTQVKLAKGQANLRTAIDAHDVTFSFGELMPEELQDGAQTWLPTRQPVLLDQWPRVAGHRDAYTTVMNWTSYKPVEFDGRVFGQKDMELMRFLDLPSQIDPPVEIAMAAGKTRSAPIDLLRHKGWQIADPNTVCPDPASYRRYLQASKGEWSVAKNGYVVGEAGWFSGRSACYLAAGRPVVAQETGFSKVLPTGLGLLAFDDSDSAVAAIESVEQDYERHSEAAEDLAREYFDAAAILESLIERSFATTVPSGRRR
jgi:hypothetical protein